MLSEVGRTVIAGVAAGCAILLLFLLFSFIFSNFKCKHYRSAGSQEDPCSYGNLQDVSYWKRRRHRNWPTKQSRIGQRLPSPSSREPPLEPALLTPTRWSPAPSYSKRQTPSSPSAQMTPSSASSRRTNNVDAISREVTEEYHGLLGTTRSENLVKGPLPDLPPNDGFDDPSAAYPRGEQRPYAPEWEGQTRPREGKASSEIDFDSFNKIIKDIDMTLKTLEHIKSPRSTYSGRDYVPARTETVPMESRIGENYPGSDAPKVSTSSSPGPPTLRLPVYEEYPSQSIDLPRRTSYKESQLHNADISVRCSVNNQDQPYHEDMPPPTKICKRFTPYHGDHQWPCGTLDTTSSCFAASRPSSLLRGGQNIQPACSPSSDNATLHPSTSALLDSHVQAQSTRLNSCIARLSISSMCESDSSTSCYESRASSPTLGALNPRRLGGFFNPVPDPSDPLCFAFSKDDSCPKEGGGENDRNRYSLHRFQDEQPPRHDSEAAPTERSSLHLRPLSSSDQNTRSLTRTSHPSKPPLPVRSSLRRSTKDPAQRNNGTIGIFRPEQTDSNLRPSLSASDNVDLNKRFQAEDVERYRDFSFERIKFRPEDAEK